MSQDKIYNPSSREFTKEQLHDQIQDQYQELKNAEERLNQITRKYQEVVYIMNAQQKKINKLQLEKDQLFALRFIDIPQEGDPYENLKEFFSGSYEIKKGKDWFCATTSNHIWYVQAEGFKAKRALANELKNHQNKTYTGVKDHLSNHDNFNNQ